MTNLLQTYLSDVRQIYSTGAATKETSFYTPLANLFNRVGDSLKPKIKCVVNIKNQGAGIPDGGFFTASQLKKDEENPLMNLPPERGVLEVKSKTWTQIIMCAKIRFMIGRILVQSPNFSLFPPAKRGGRNTLKRGL